MTTPSRKPALTLSLAALLAAGAGITAVTWAVPSFLEGQRATEGAQTSYITPSPLTTPSSQAPASQVDAAVLTQRLNQLAEGYTSGNVTLLVSDQATGEVLYERGADQLRIPASNFKLLTDYALLRTQDPYHRYSTKIVAQDKQLTLVAGGDTLLGTGKSAPQQVIGHAGLATLTEETITALTQQGAQGQYTLNLDTSIYEGNPLHPGWDPEDISAGFVTGVRPLAFYSHYSPDQGKAGKNRPQDAAVEVQQEALAQLNALGAEHNLTFVAGQEEAAPASARTLASVESATAAEQAAYMMLESDNMLAEVLARNAAVAHGRPGSLEGARQTLLEVLEEDKIPTQGLVISDFSGLSLDNRVSASTLSQIVSRILKGEDGLDAALDGFPIAGGSGTLAQRFDDPAEEPAQGFARAKTGTLNSVIALSGYTSTSSGQVLVYSIITNDVTNPEEARNLLDSMVAAITEG